MINLCTDYVNPKIKSIYFAIQNQLKVGNYHFVSGSESKSDNDFSPIENEDRLVKKSVESLIALWHIAHNNDRYKSYYNSIMLPNYFIFPNDSKAIMELLNSIDFHELLVLISPVTVRDGLSEKEQQQLNQLQSKGTNRYSNGSVH